jgi:hypothetical protein
MKVTRDTLLSKVVETQKSSLSEQMTLQELAELSLEAFWKQESRYINQVLYRLLGKKRIIGVAKINRWQWLHTQI